MLFFGSMLVGGLKFVLDSVAAAASRELDDPDRWRTELLELQLRFEDGEIDESTYAARERVILEHLRTIHPERGSGAVMSGQATVASVEVDGVDWDEDRE